MSEMKQNQNELETEYELSCGQQFALWICCRKRENETDDIFEKAYYAKTIRKLSSYLRLSLNRIICHNSVFWADDFAKIIRLKIYLE
ncbi:unnamed protein product [Oikopleura dioica]|uniref:Uncharacterized protein n=1 Tax=Oikopleura dioica TaxID=34765 RepID=E4Y1H0_OIKDI|nr:unnamed protein product [Oikopleura dioica]